MSGRLPQSSVDASSLPLRSNTTAVSRLQRLYALTPALNVYNLANKGIAQYTDVQGILNVQRPLRFAA